MNSSKLRHAAFLFATLATGLALGCETEDPPRSDATDAAVTEDADGSEGDDDDGDDDDDDDDDGGGDGARVSALAAPGGAPPAGHDPVIPLHPCGDGSVDDGEECDDGVANGNDRECTLACTLNHCELDERGVCTPAADVDLYPCTPGYEDVQGCALGLASD
jgi:hypothetical protein